MSVENWRHYTEETMLLLLLVSLLIVSSVSFSAFRSRGLWGAIESFITCAQQVSSPDLSAPLCKLKKKFHWLKTLVDYYHLAESDTRGCSGM